MPTGIYDPRGMGSIVFTVLAVAAQLDRDYIREKTLEGQQAAAASGNHGRRPEVIDEDDVLFARARPGGQRRPRLPAGRRSPDSLISRHLGSGVALRRS
jgi:DNA invertase Pin-like site-specific DNA recombinase